MSNLPAALLMAPVASLEVRSYIGLNNGELPHTFLHVIDVNGQSYDFGFAPQQSGSLLGAGEIFNDYNHPFTNSSGAITLSADQGIALQQYINTSIAAPPIYSIPSGSQCSVWALNGVVNALTGAGAQNPSVATNLQLGLYIDILANPFTEVAFNAGTQSLHFVGDVVTGALDALNPSGGNSGITITKGIASPIVPGGLSAYKPDTVYWELNGPNYTGRLYDNGVLNLTYADHEVWKMPAQTGKGGWTESSRRFDPRTGVTLQTDVTEFKANGSVGSVTSSLANGSYTKVVTLPGGLSEVYEFNTTEHYSRVTKELANGNFTQVTMGQYLDTNGRPIVTMSQYESADGSYSRLKDNLDGTITATIYDAQTKVLTRSTSSAAGTKVEADDGQGYQSMMMFDGNGKSVATAWRNTVDGSVFMQRRQAANSHAWRIAA